MGVICHHHHHHHRHHHRHRHHHLHLQVCDCVGVGKSCLGNDRDVVAMEGEDPQVRQTFEEKNKEGKRDQGVQNHHHHHHPHSPRMGIRELKD